jgi:hypothetical protein
LEVLGIAVGKSVELVYIKLIMRINRFINAGLVKNCSETDLAFRSKSEGFGVQ